LTWKFASRRNAVHFLNISTSQCDPSYKWGAFTILTLNTGYTFSTSELPKVLWTWSVLAFWLPNLLLATMGCETVRVVDHWSPLDLGGYGGPPFCSYKA
jgi:hypothetical protein